MGRKKTDARCEMCGGMLPRFDQAAEFVLGFNLTITKDRPKEHYIAWRNTTSWTASRYKTDSWKLCEDCARKVTKVIQDTMKTFGKAEQTTIE